MANTEMPQCNTLESYNSSRMISTSFASPLNSLSQQLNSPHAGSKRKASEDQNTNPVPHKKTARLETVEQHPQRELFCEICNVQLNSITQTLQHREGKAHLNKLKKVEEFKTVWQNSTEHNSTNSVPLHLQVNHNLPPAKQAGNGNLQCAICQKSFNSESQATQHFQSPKHRQKLNSVEDSREEISSAPGANELLTQQELNTDGTSHTYDVPANVDRTFPLSPAKTKAMELYCEICGLMMNSIMQMKTHLQGSKHKNNFANKQPKNHPQIELRCMDCTTTFNSQTQMIQHMTSPKHMNKAKRKQTNGQFTASTRGRGRGRGFGRGRGEASRGGYSHRGRGRATAKLPPLAASFVKVDTMMSNHGNHFFHSAQPTINTTQFPVGPSFQQPFT